MASYSVVRWDPLIGIPLQRLPAVWARGLWPAVFPLFRISRHFPELKVSAWQYSLGSLPKYLLCASFNAYLRRLLSLLWPEWHLENLVGFQYHSLVFTMLTVLICVPGSDFHPSPFPTVVCTYSYQNWKPQILFIKSRVIWRLRHFLDFSLSNNTAEKLLHYKRYKQWRCDNPGWGSVY